MFNLGLGGFVQAVDIISVDGYAMLFSITLWIKSKKANRYIDFDLKINDFSHSLLWEAIEIDSFYMCLFQ